jgi:acyl-CoA synthetase (AMP-forming)/AMP-acid ligase II
MVLHFACAALRCPLLNLNTHLVSRELSHILRDSGAKTVFARREPHGDILRSVVGADAEPGAVSLREILSVVWVPNLKKPAATPSRASTSITTVSDASESANSGAAAVVTAVAGLKNFEWVRDVLTGGGGLRGGGGSFPFFSEAAAAGGGGGSDNAHMYYTSGTTGNPKVGLYTLNPVDPYIGSDWFLTCDILASNLL